MPISFPQPPQHVAEARGLTEGMPPPMPAQPVFTVGLDDLLEAGGGEAQESVTAPPTWRSSGFDAGGAPEVLELPAEPEEAAAAAATGDDRFGPSIREALAVAELDPRAGEHDYEARLFRVPALSLLALWLHADSSVDLFVPVGRAAPGLDPNRVYPDDEFMAAVRTAGEQLRTAYDEAENPDELGS
jgi:hypothetical protein